MDPKTTESNFKSKSKLDPKDPEQLSFWSRQFGVPLSRLQKAIERVGPDVKDIGSYIKNRS
jgi:hypothetical protein